MARVDKVDNSLKKRLERKENKRSENTRDKRVYFLIVCEGEKTEPNYFKSFKKELPPGTVKIDLDGTGYNTIRLIEHAISKRDKSGQKYDRVWAVFDRDGFSEEHFNGAIEKASVNKINCAWSNEAFELWFLLHFQYVNNCMERSKYKSYLGREIRKSSGMDNYEYKKNDPQTYHMLKQYGNQKQAMERAKKLINNFTCTRYAIHNPCTRVHELIEELLNPQHILKKIREEKGE